MDGMNAVERYMPYNEDGRQSIPYICRDRRHLHRTYTRILLLCHRDGVAHQDIQSDRAPSRILEVSRPHMTALSVNE